MKSTAVPSRDILSNSIVNLVSQPRSRRRVNVAVTEGHEEDVGTKTSFYCAAFRSLSNSLMSGRPFGLSVERAGATCVFLEMQSKLCGAS